MTVCLSTTLRAPLDMTLDSVHYHLNLGVDKMYLFFDDPGDVAVERFAGEARVTVMRCDEKHWRSVGLAGDEASTIENRQSANTTAALAMARAAGHDWLIHLDGDGLICSSVPLPTLTNVPDEIDVVLVPLMEAVPDRLDHIHPFREVRDFKTTGLKQNVWRRYSFPQTQRHRSQHDPFERALRWARRFRVRAAMGDEYFRGATAPRPLIRVTDKVESVRVLGPTLAGDLTPRAMVTNHAALLHFDAYDFEVWRLKWKRRLDGTASAERMRPARRRLKRQFDVAFDAGDEQTLQEMFRQWHMATWRERMVLRSLGLLRRISLDQRLFELPSDGGSASLRPP